jgi:hypothetical protein
LDAGSEPAASVGANCETDGASTATGPTNEAANAATGSEALRHEQECESGVTLGADREWCIGHIPPSE